MGSGLKKVKRTFILFLFLPFMCGCLGGGALAQLAQLGSLFGAAETVGLGGGGAFTELAQLGLLGAGESLADFGGGNEFALLRAGSFFGGGGESDMATVTNPEPTSILLLGSGLVATAFCRRKARK